MCFFSWKVKNDKKKDMNMCSCLLQVNGFGRFVVCVCVIDVKMAGRVMILFCVSNGS
jgi:hypothetical protein